LEPRLAKTRDLKQLSEPDAIPGLPFQVLRDHRKLLEGRFEIGRYICCDRLWRRKIGAFFKRLVFEPKDVEVNFVSFQQLLIRERAESSLLISLASKIYTARS
jgi:hypothetical protein